MKKPFPFALGVLSVVMVLAGSGMAAAQAPLPVAPSPDATTIVAAPESPAGGGGPGPISMAFTYQGQLRNASGPVNGTCDLKFGLWGQSIGGTMYGVTDEELAVTINQGLFNVVLNSGDQFGPDAFRAARWLEIGVRCPANTGLYTTLSPRQPLWAAPYAAGLASGARVQGSDYQIVKIMSDATTLDQPAAVTGEMRANIANANGVGVYGSANSTSTGSAGAGVWGRSYNLAGAGVRGTGLNGSAGVLGEAVDNWGVGVKAVSSADGLANAALAAEAKSMTAAEPAGIAVYGLNHGGDATIVAKNSGAGDLYRGINGANYIVFRVTNTGRVVTSAVQITGGGDVAEGFQSTGGKPEPGTLMVIDPEHPGKLMPSSYAYDTRVAGIVSGAGGVNPGMTLQQEGVMEGDTPVAVSGRVYVKAEALSVPIKAGDLLTTSDIAGYAMKAGDRERRQGAVIGKAMTELSSGRGLVLVLVSLQ